MKKINLYLIAFATLTCIQPLKADEKNTNANDTIKTYNIDEVIITTSAKETNDLRTLPGAFSILSPQDINNRQVYALKDISSFVPNLYIPDYGSRQTSAIYIRGIGARSSGQSIGLYVDNVPYLDKSTFDFELMDIQRIEVLRGPQGTLYGRNAMGGIINIYTQSPLNYQGTRIQLSAGNYGTYKAKASHSTKLAENLGLTISGYYDHNDGFFTNEFTGKKVDKGDAAGGRLKLDWLIHPNLKASYSFTYDYTDQGAFAYGLYDKATNIINPINYNDPSSYKRDVLSNNLSFEYKTENIILTSTTGFQYLKDDMIMDQDFSPKSIFVLNQKQRQRAFSEEIALKSNTKNNYQWSVGLYGFYNNLHTDGPVTFKEDGIQEILQTTFDKLKEDNPRMPELKVTDEELYIPGSFKTPSYGGALFHQSTYNNLFTDGFSITAGIRLDYEKQKMDYYSEALMNLGFRMSPYAPFTPIKDHFPYDPSVMDVHLSQDFWQVLPKVTLKYECTPRTFTYVSVAKGYKAGGYNVQMSADIMQEQMKNDVMSAIPFMNTDNEPLVVEDAMSYKPEHSWNYELGAKSELIQGVLNSELTLFYTDIRDIQLTQFVESGNGRILTNAGKARSYGVEATLRARLTNELSADLNYGYTHATFRNYIHGEKDTDGNVVETNCKDNYIPYIPQHTLNVGLQYVKLFRNRFIDQFNAAVQFSGTGKIHWTEINDIEQKFYGTMNAKVGVRKGIVKVDLWSRNLTDTQYAAFYFESFGNPYIQKGKPFQIGVDLTFAF